jgi:hypothetical protein
MKACWLPVSVPARRTSGDPGGLDPTVPEHELRDDVLGRGFSYVPVTRPDGLRRLTSSAGTGGLTVDGYQVGAERVRVLVEFAERATGTCSGIKADPGSGICVGEGVVDGPGLRHLTVYLRQAGVRSTQPEDASAGVGVGRFWVTVEMVPVAEARWFGELVARAEAAPRVELG